MENKMKIVGTLGKHMGKPRKKLKKDTESPSKSIFYQKKN
jgi:hypothetical protein